jgi:ketosteroid isomerase-like protein
MSQENAEVVGRLVEDMNRASRPWDALHPEVEWHLDSDHPDQAVLYGPHDVLRYFADWRDSFDTVRIEADDYQERGNHVVMPLVVHGTLKGSTAEVLLAETWVFELRDALIVEVREYLSLDAALKAIEK